MSILERFSDDHNLPNYDMTPGFKPFTVSNECRKTKTTVDSPANQPITTKTNYPMNQSELEANTCNRRQARENASEQVPIVSLLLLIGLESGARFFNQSQSEVKQNQSKTRITFDTKLKTALIHVCFGFALA